MSGPLAGIKILEMTAVVLGPWACQILADMGAEVIKLESGTHIDGLRQGWQGKDSPPSLENQPNFHIRFPNWVEK